MTEFNIIPRPALVHRVEHRHQYRKAVDYDQEDRNYAPNFKHSDGRIYASKSGEPYWVVTVSPYHPNFKNQIEPGVWPIVEQLINKNYLTVSSCEGHGTDSKMTVTLVFKDIDDAQKFIDTCSHIPGWYYDIEANRRSFYNKSNSGSNVISEKTTQDLTENCEVFRRYNILFFKKYKRYVYLDLVLYKFPEPRIQRFVYKYILRKPCKEFFVNKQLMINFLKNELPINSY
jgi:hypothetical protein